VIVLGRVIALLPTSVIFSCLLTAPVAADNAIDAARIFASKKVSNGNPADFELLQETSDSAVVTFTATNPAKFDGHKLVIPAVREQIYAFLEPGEGGRWSVRSTQWQYSLAWRATELWSTPVAKLAENQGIELDSAYRMRDRFLLAASTDKNLVRHFLDNRAVFERIDGEVRRRSAPMAHYDTSDPEMGALLSSAQLEAVDAAVFDRAAATTCKASGCLTLTIAGDPFSRVGYFHVPPLTPTPKMTSRNYLAIRPLGDGWYLFRQRTL
jgi:hypothetical protein